MKHFLTAMIGLLFCLATPVQVYAHDGHGGGWGGGHGGGWGGGHGGGWGGGHGGGWGGGHGGGWGGYGGGGTTFSFGFGFPGFYGYPYGGYANPYYYGYGYPSYYGYPGYYYPYGYYPQKYTPSNQDSTPRFIKASGGGHGGGGHPATQANQSPPTDQVPAGRASRPYVDDEGRTCRNFQTFMSGAPINGTACLGPEGDWHTVE